MTLTFIPLEFLLIPSGAPLSFFDFVGYARVHIAPVLLLADKKYSAGLKELEKLTLTGEAWRRADDEERLPDEAKQWIERLKKAIASIGQLPVKIHSEATSKTERFMRERIESDGTLYSYASATFLMIFALLALGFNRHDPVIVNAVQGLKTFVAPAGDGRPHVQNSPSTVWDTALICCALQSAGYASHEAVAKAVRYILSRQHTKYGDWRIRNERAIPGGWGFSDSNSINPDVDDTTAALRAIRLLRDAGDPAYRESWNRGLQWVLSMQNDDGGWSAFEKNTDSSLFTLLPVQNAEAAAIDPSSADLTGRTLEFLGAHAGLRAVLPFVRRGVGWLYDHQLENGSWYGRWGICYLYGTWAALTGLSAVGVPPEERNVKRAVRWLREVQNDDGGWGESCRSDQAKEYVPLGRSTLSQTAWAVEAILSVERSASEEVNRGVRLLVEASEQPKRQPPKQMRYPTGAGLPGSFYAYYHSYNYIWPLLALCRYREHASR